MESRNPTPTSTDPAALHRALVDRLVREGVLHSPPVEAAFRAVPRHLFLPEFPLRQVYDDEAIVTRHAGAVPLSSSSQPSMMAIMLEQLDLQPGHRVLEIGTATGYNAALLAHIVGEEGSVVTIDIDPELVEGAREHLLSAGYERVTALAADGGFGYPDGAPYDRIISTVGVWDVPPAWIEQLAPDGRLVVPLALVGVYQKSIAFERRGDHLESASYRNCGFVHLQGAFREGENVDRSISVGDGALRFDAEFFDASAADAEDVARLLDGSWFEYDTGLSTNPRELHNRLLRRLSLQLPGLCTLATNEPERFGQIPFLFSGPDGLSVAVGEWEPGSLALIVDRAEEGEAPNESFDVVVRGFGEEGCARKVAALIADWKHQGKPNDEPGLHFSLYPIDAHVDVAPTDLVIDKRDHRIVVRRDHEI